MIGIVEMGDWSIRLSPLAGTVDLELDMDVACGSSPVVNDMKKGVSQNKLTENLLGPACKNHLYKNVTTQICCQNHLFCYSQWYIRNVSFLCCFCEVEAGKGHLCLLSCKLLFVMCSRESPTLFLFPCKK